jgi:hypothetical protein
MRAMTAGLLVYLLGVGIGLIRADAPPGRRLALALAWPLGLVACAITVTALLAASAILFPVAGAAALAAILLWWILW